MKTEEDAKELAHAMVRIGNNVGRQTMAVISDMSQPLGFAIGNALEVKEAIDTLKGEGPEDLTELVLVLGSQMVVLAKKANTLEEAREMLIEVMKNGKATEKFKEFLSNQGGDSSIVDNPEKMPQAKYVIDVPAKTSGVISNIVADEIGIAAMLLGAGRATKEDEIDLAVGLMLRKKVGDAVKEGEPFVTIYANRENVEDVKAKIYENISIAETAVAPKLVHTVITD
ncbi:pyrimidine-nucleoside phosphorylase [Streptococcus pneumoniae]|nr:pyrimidine-nucleoside phosphorylase [Streptococcus pneumoniae]COK48649.1 pyrimidine-nucleoside phosphorylase [Streptococcus pneumoniae]